MRLDRSALWFNLGREADTRSVVYRLDGGPPQTLTDANLDPLRVSDTVALNNPSGGEVGLPLSTLVGVRLVWIRAEDQRRPQRFDVSRLTAALALAANLHCPEGAATPVVRAP